MKSERTRPLAPAQRTARALALMESVLRAGRPLAHEYPLVFGDGAPGGVETVEEDGDVRSACARLARTFVVRGERLRIGLVGSVVTDPDWRGRGLASRALDAACERLREQGCALALLWADEPGFYERRGWRALGHEVDFAVPADARARLPRCDSVRLGGARDALDLLRLHEHHATRVERSAEEMHALLAGPEMGCLVAERAGEPVAYACLGRGEDLRRVVHEWAGAPDDVLGLVRAHMDRERLAGQPGDVVLMTPSDAAELHERLAALGMPRVDGVLAQGKILDVGGVVEWLQVLGGGRDAVARHGDAGPVRLQGPRGEIELSPPELAGLLLPPRADRAPIERVERATGCRFPGLPLAPFAWGLDSI